jgi:glutaredoxin
MPQRIKMRMLFMLSFAVAVAEAQAATTLYKSIGPDGKITYSDQPLAQARDTKTLTFASAPTSPLSAETLAYIDQLQKSANARAAAPAAVSTPVLYSASWCGYCKQAKAYLTRKQVAYSEVDIDIKDGLAAYARAGGGGGKGVPLLVANGKSMFGFSAAGYDTLLAVPKK